MISYRQFQKLNGVSEVNYLKQLLVHKGRNDFQSPVSNIISTVQPSRKQGIQSVYCTTSECGQACNMRLVFQRNENDKYSDNIEMNMYLYCI
jgi:hypothetical protein